jgi:hypothetical protein
MRITTKTQTTNYQNNKLAKQHKQQIKKQHKQQIKKLHKQQISKTTQTTN